MKFEYEVFSANLAKVERPVKVDGADATLVSERMVMQLKPVNGGHGTIRLEALPAEASGFKPGDKVVVSVVKV